MPQVFHQSRIFPIILPLMLGGSVALGVLALRAQLISIGDDVVSSRIQSAHVAISSDLEEAMDLRRDAFTRLADRVAMLNVTGGPDWTNDADDYLDDFPELSVLTWRSESGDIAWEHRRSPTNTLPDAADCGSVKSGFHPINAAQVLLCASSQKGQGGQLTAVLEVHPMLEDALQNFLHIDIPFAIVDENGVLFRSSLPIVEEEPASGTVAVDGLRWSLVQSRVQRLTRDLTQLFPNVVLAVGLALALAVGTASYFALSARRRRIAAERALETLSRESRTRHRVSSLLEAFLETTEDAIFVKDLEGRYELANKAAGRLYGTDAAELIGKTDAQMLDPQRAEHYAKADRNVLNDGDVTTRTDTVDVDGKQHVVEWTRGPLRDQHNALVGTFGLARDVTRQENARKALAQSVRLLSSIVNAQQDVNSAVLPADVKKVAANWARSLSNAKAAVVHEGGQNSRTVAADTDAFHPCASDEPVMAIPMGFEGASVGEIEIYSDAKGTLDTGSFEALELVSAVTAANLAKARAYEALAATRDELQRSNAELEQFAYVASHDLQEPLRMVASFTQLLEKRYADKLDDAGREFIAYAVDGATRMQRLINDLLTYSRLGVGAVPKEPVCLEECMRQALANLADMIASSGGKITHDPLPVVPGEGTQLTQVLQNLLANALKFVPESRTPEIHVSVKALESAWQICVRDNGIGIAPEHTQRIFQIFQRLHSTGEYTGTGIGLAICRRIVDRHDGDIWAQSEDGTGASFYFTLPTERATTHRTEYDQAGAH